MTQRVLTPTENELGEVLNNGYMAPEVKAGRLLRIVEALVNENLAPAMARARAEGYARAREQAVAIADREVKRADPAKHHGVERIHRQIGADTAAIIACDILDMKDETP